MRRFSQRSEPLPLSIETSSTAAAIYSAAQNFYLSSCAVENCSRYLFRRPSQNDSKSCLRYSSCSQAIAPSRTATAFYCAVNRKTSPCAVPAISSRRRDLLSAFITPSRTATAFYRAITHCYQDLFRRPDLLSLFRVMSRPVTAIYCAVQSQNESKNCLRYLLRRQALSRAVEKCYRFYCAVIRSTFSRAVSAIYCVVENRVRYLLHPPELRPLSSHQALLPIVLLPSRTSLPLSHDVGNCYR